MHIIGTRKCTGRAHSYCFRYARLILLPVMVLFTEAALAQPPQIGSGQWSGSTGNYTQTAWGGMGLAETGSADPTRSSILPQFAFGGGWYSALYFTNFTGTAVSFPVNFVSDAGTPLTVPSLGGSTTQVNLAAYGTAIIEAPNVGSLVQGYAEFTLPSGVSGYGVFRQSVAGRPDQEAVVPFSDAGASSNTLTWDETSLTTSVAVVNPSSTATTVAVTLWDKNGNIIGTSSIPLPPNGKTEPELRNLSGLGGMVGQRGAAQFTVSAGSVAVLGLRFGASAFTSIPTTNPQAGASGVVVAELALAQTGMAIGQASTVLQSQFAIFGQLTEGAAYCTALTGGGSVASNGSNTVTVYYDSSCKQPYIVANVNAAALNNGVITETAAYDGLNGTNIGTMTLNEGIQGGETNYLVYGLGVFTPASGARTPVQLGVYCTLGFMAAQCAGAIAQDFPALGIAIGAVTPLTLSYSLAGPAPVTFTGGGSAVTGPIGSLTLTNPTPTSLVIQGGTAYTSTTASGGAGAFDLFPPTPTSWTLTDSAHDQQFQISVVDDKTRNLTMTITQVSTGNTLATGALDQSGSGAITYSDGSIAVITNWTLAD